MGSDGEQSSVVGQAFSPGALEAVAWWASTLREQAMNRALARAASEGRTLADRADVDLVMVGVLEGLLDTAEYTATQVEAEG